MIANIAQLNMSGYCFSNARPMKWYSNSFLSTSDSRMATLAARHEVILKPGLVAQKVLICDLYNVKN